MGLGRISCKCFRVQLGGAGSWYCWYGPYCGGGYASTSASAWGNGRATAYASASGNWWHKYIVPIAYWDNWVALNGSYIPIYMNWWYWGNTAPIGTLVTMSVTDNILNTTQTVLNDGFIRQADGTYLQVGTVLNPADIVNGVIMGHNPNVQRDTPYNIAFLTGASILSSDGTYYTLGTDFTTGGGWSSTAPEPASLALLGLAGLAGAFARRRQV